MTNPSHPQSNGLFEDIQPEVAPESPSVNYADPQQHPQQNPPSPVAGDQPVYTLTQSQLEQLIDQTTARVQQNMVEPTIQDRLIPEAPPLQPDADSDDDDDISQLMWENPQAFAEKIEQRAFNKFQQQQQAQQNIEQFWNNFYQSNPDLDRVQDHALIQQTLNQHMDKFGNMPLPQVIPQLAQLVRSQLSSYAARFTNQPNQNAMPASPAPFVGEQPNPVAVPPGAQPQQAAPLPPASSISSLLKARQAARFSRHT